MKLSKVLTKKHQQAVALVKETRPLTYDEKFFVAEFWNPTADHNPSWAGIYFTPMGLADDLQIETSSKPGKRVMDLCAGTGRLALHAWQKMQWNSYGGKVGELVCVERNPAFVEVGKRILPEATWICGDIADCRTFAGIGRFDEVISNPPFGLTMYNDCFHSYTSQFAAAEVAMTLAKSAIFILPQGDCPFAYSGNQSYQRKEVKNYEKFNKDTGIYFGMNCGVDTSQYESEWVGTKIRTEIVLISKEAPDKERTAEIFGFPEKTVASQISMFG